MLLGKSAQGEVRFPKDALLRHMACLGASGSGKTVACKVVCEEAIRQDVPIIAIDPQGDIASFALPNRGPSAIGKGVPYEVVRDFYERVEPAVYTPGSNAGIPLSINPFKKPEGAVEDQIRQRAVIAKSLASLMSFNGKNAQAVEAVLELAVERLFEGKRRFEGGEVIKEDLMHLGVDGLAQIIEEQQAELSRFASKATLKDLARRLRTQAVGARGMLFNMGQPIDIDQMIRGSGHPGRVPLNVIYLNGLATQEDKNFFLAVFMQEMYRWMLKNPSRKLQALFYLDEIAPFIPPVRKTACKDMLRLFFKQARKYGLGCLIATQNPGDIDYTALAQFSTWNLGRMVTKQDREKVAGAIKSVTPNAENVVEQLAGLKVGEFRLVSPDQFEGPLAYKVRWLVSAHETLDEEAIRELSA